jgi:hypothetical protein
MRRPGKFRHLVTICTILIFLLAGCGTVEVTSVWRDRDVKIDGADSGAEWDNARHPIVKGHVTVGFMNDEQYLYLLFSTRNPTVQRLILAAGLTVWLDDKGGRGTTYGIHFPTGDQSLDEPRMSRRERDRKKREAAATDPILDVMMGEIKIIGPGKNERSFIAAENAASYGIHCRIGETDGEMVYELRVPLLRSEAAPYGIAARKVKVIGIGLETGKIDKPSEEPQDSGQSRRARTRPGAIPNNVGTPQGSIKSLDQWLKVTLGSIH